MPETVAWKDPACPIKVEYDPAALECVRRLAVDGLLSLPRVGLGVGGFLLGTREAGAVSVLDFVPIDCSHASGPSFAPTLREVEQGRTAAREKAGTSLEILGYYCSRPRQPLQIAEKDQILYRTLCPGAGQFALLIRPSTTEESCAGLFYRKNNGYLAGGTELPLTALVTAPVEAANDEIIAVEEPAPPPIEIPPPPPPPPQLFGEPEPASFPAFAAPGFTAVAPRKISWPALAAPALVVVILVILFTTREQWLPRPPVELRTAETDGHFSIEWNRDAVRGLDHAVLTVIDGTTTKPIQLDGRQLEAGTLPYPRQTTQFTATLDAGSIHASATFVPPPVLPVPQLPDASPAADAAAQPSHP